MFVLRTNWSPQRTWGAVCALVATALTTGHGQGVEAPRPGGGWHAERTISIAPTGYAVHWPSLTLSGDTLIVAGVLSPSRALSASLGSAGVVLRHPGAALPLPDHAARFAYPRGSADSEGAYHLVWGESPGAAADAPTGSLTITELWYAKFTDGSWSPSERLLSAEIIRWGGDQGSIVAEGGKGFGVLVSVFRDGYRNTVVFLHRDKTQWGSTDLGILATYVSVISESGRLVAALLSPSPTSTRKELALIARESIDGGLSWSAAQVLATIDQRASRSLTLAKDAHGLHALWLEPHGRGADSVRVRHIWRAKGSKKWDEHEAAGLPNSNITRFWVAPGACDDWLAIAESVGLTTNGPRLQMHQALWHDNHVQTSLLFPSASYAGVPGRQSSSGTSRQAPVVSLRAVNEASAAGLSWKTS
jgi:hypothetical protein